MSERRHLPLALIDMGERLRPIDPAWAEALATSFAERGQDQPIVVRPAGERFVLVAGGHRLAAAQILGWAEIDVTVKAIDALAARLAEIDENLIRHELSALDRAVFLAERKKVWEELHPETAHGGDRKSLAKKGENQVATVATRFSAEIAEKIGLSERSVRRAAMIAEAIPPEIRERLRSTYLVDHVRDLEAFAKLSPDEQISASRALVEGRAETLKAVFAPVTPGAGPDGLNDERAFAKFVDLWSRSSAKAKRRMLAHAGVGTVAIDAAINPRGKAARAARGNPVGERG